MKGQFWVLATILASLVCVQGDLYMHAPRGSNNRLNEANRDRQNGARLYDSQDNNRGGVNVGSYGRPYYYVGSTLMIEWSIQHSCGMNNNCELIMQYYCDDNVTRDGLTTNTIPNPTNPTDAVQQCSGPDGEPGDCDGDTRYGRHESWDSYKQCMYRQRNMGLWTSAQDMRNRPGAIYTRQNNNGNRRGYECPEERDYYPYWHPTIWTDIAILTSNTARCASYQKESQNMAAKGYCYWTDQQIQTYLNSNPRTDNSGQITGFIPNNKLDCEPPLGQGQWIVQPSWHDINPLVGPPDCQQGPWTRDNAHSHAVGSNEWPAYNWTIPAAWVNESCVLRMRYNISSSETQDFYTAGDHLADWHDISTAKVGLLNATYNANYNVHIPSGLSTDENDEFSYRYSATNPLWKRYGLTYAENAAMFDPTACLTNTNCYSRGYAMADDPVVDIFGSLLAKPMARLELAVDTSQFARTFQDRSHVFAIRQPPSQLAGQKIWNLGVRGKRGNNQQVYPSIEYDFTPTHLYIEQGDFVHFQWHGSNTNPNNNAGQGTQGQDRSNIVLLRSFPPQYDNIAQLAGPAPGHTGAIKQSYPAMVTDTSNAASFLGLSTDIKSQLAIPGYYTPLVDVGPVQALQQGIFDYLCTRNHAFTNRDQKGRIIVSPNTSPQGFQLIETPTLGSKLIAPNGNAWLRFAPDPVGLTTGSQLQITMDNGIVHVTPPMFDIIKGQSVILEIAYTYAPLQNVFVEQSDYADFSVVNEMTPSANGGIASLPITRGGYYWVNIKVSVGGVVGIVIGCSIAIGGAAALWWKLRKSYSYGGKKKHLIDDPRI